MQNNRVYDRLLSLHFLVAVLNLAVDFEHLAGPEGLLPCAEFLHRTVVPEFSRSSLFLYFPTLLYWFAPRTLLVAGIFVGAKSVAKPQRLDYAVMYGSYLSFSFCRGLTLWFPWDCVLLELLLLRFICPHWEFGTRFLLFRILFGFGKHKFLGAKFPEDLLYLKSMACWQPLASNLGRLASAVPGIDWVHAIGLVFTFFVECVACWTLVISSTPFVRRATCACVGALMAGIQLLGHFAWFNTVTALLALKVFRDTTDGEVDMARRGTAAVAARGVCGRAARALYVAAAVAFVLPSQWSSPGVFYENQLPPVFRVLSAWRVLHSYGVFPPQTLPMLKPVGRFEFRCVSDEPDTWHSLDFKHQHSRSTTRPDWPPLLLAPWRFPRFDYLVGFYGASHVFSLVSGLGPLWGSGMEMTEAVVGKIFSGQVSEFFVEQKICQKIDQVRLLVVSVRPKLTPGNVGTGWEQVTAHVDGIWNSNPVTETSSFVLNLPPQMVALRLLGEPAAAAVSDVNNECALLWHEAHKHVDWSGFRSTHAELAAVTAAFRELAGRQQETRGPGHPGCREISKFPLPGWEYARKWAGTMGCFTAFHLIPPFLHPGVCKQLVRENLTGDQSFEYTRLVVPAWMQHYFTEGAVSRLSLQC